jgi:hypothetical protein
MELQLLKLSICVLSKKEVRADDVRRHHHRQHQQLPHEYLQTVVQFLMQSQDLHNAKWRCDLASLTPDKRTTMWLLHMGWLQMGRGGGSPSHPPSPQTQHGTHPPEMGAALLDLLRVKKP